MADIGAAVPVALLFNPETLSEGASSYEPLPISLAGTTYTMAQAVRWLDEDNFAVGRWDGTLSIFSRLAHATDGPLLSSVITTPKYGGIEMVTFIALRVFATSNDSQSIPVWRAVTDAFHDIDRQQMLTYDASCGVANGGVSVVLDGTLYFASGHSEGYLNIWEGAPDGTSLQGPRTVDLRSTDPANPYNLQHIRSVQLLPSDGALRGCVVTGSENGRLAVVRLRDGTVISQVLYDPEAMLGINSVATVGYDVLVGNCIVAKGAPNLWYYRVDPESGKIAVKASTCLQVDKEGHSPAYTFCVTWGVHEARPCFYATTSEGYLWMGTIDDSSGDGISLMGHTKVSSHIGAAQAFNARQGSLIVAGRDIHAYNTVPGVHDATVDNPEALAIG